ncbi:ras guanine nucleotide exchange factor domain-containing protein [Mycotypha africana]|uniref:ras guanine nucleotide exchange factor domain-containing protein n=1 Tax=Mycotypha africana TaxID=64632 RepID=UPI002301A933|nr:ras guanine nucleotide exchange factor domain-containing protein [Mycotypha africana]KAI8979667.1 ras guanine nucleotide exchange factor domain-containing protein [Mycotypha africana]
MTSHFVQALHDYLPSSVTTEESASCLFFKKGAIIEVFNKDDSGWWDGQCGDVRGWFPSNYVGRIGELKRQNADFEDNYYNEDLELWHHKMNQPTTNNTTFVSHTDYGTTKFVPTQGYRSSNSSLRRPDRDTSNSNVLPLFSTNSMHSLIGDVSNRVADLVDACNNPSESDIQLFVFQVVASVRSVLTEANIVNKESPLLNVYPDLSRQRKIVLSALSRLVLKGKEFQQINYMSQSQTDEDQVSYLADQLLNEMNILENLLLALSRQSFTLTESTADTTRPSSMFTFDTPRSSISSFGHNSLMSAHSGNMRPVVPEARYSTHSSVSIKTRTTVFSDKDSILQTVLDHQTCIDELIGCLVMAIEHYLINSHRATEMLETTRKAVEAVRSFLSVVENICSSLNEPEYSKQLSAIRDDQRLVTVIISKETVYSAITNLVTAVRALSAPQQTNEFDRARLRKDYDNLCSCCENVIKTTNECAACIRVCLQTGNENGRAPHLITRNMQDRPTSEYQRQELNANRVDTIANLGRKAISLQAIQQYREEHPENKNPHEERGEKGHAEQDIEALAIETVPKISTNTEIPTMSRLSSLEEGVRSSLETTTYNSSNLNYRSLPSSSSLPSPSISTSTMDSVILPGNITTQTASSLETIVPEACPPRKSKMRPRAASVNNSVELPFLTSKNNSNIKSSVTAAFPLPPTVSLPSIQDLGRMSPKEAMPKLRRPRGVSVSSLRPSMSKPKIERISTSASSESLPESLNKISSWISLNNPLEESHKNTFSSEKETSTVSTPAQQISFTKSENEYSFLKQRPFSEEEMILNADGEVIGATVEALVRKLTLHEKSPDLIFTRAFFYNFRLFTNPPDFVKLLQERFVLRPPSDSQLLTDEQIAIWTNRILIPVRLRVYNVIKTWMENYFDYEQDACVEHALTDFASNEMTKAMPGPAKRMIDLIKKTFSSKGQSCSGHKHSYNESRVAMQKSNSFNLQSSSSTSNGSNTSLFGSLTLFDDHHQTDSTDKYPSTIMSKSLRNTLRKALTQNILSLLHVNDIEPLELARQLTLLESDLFCRIRPNEMIGQEFKKKVGTSQAVHVKAMIQKSTQITSWVSDTILNEADTKKRAQVLKYWIKVGDVCLQLNNYNTLMAIRSALDSTSIARLKKTWDYLSIKYKAMWEPIHRATDSQRNFAEYRQRLKSTVAPCLPFLGVYLTDMTFIDDGNSDYRTSPGGKQLVNFDKYVKITRILSEIDQFQIPYKLFEVEEIQRYLQKTLSSVEQDDQVFYVKSLKREPKEEEA